MEHNVEVKTKNKYIAISDSSKAYSWHNVPSLDALLHNSFTYDLSGNRVRAEIRETDKPRRTIDYSYHEAGELLLKTDSRYGTTVFTYDTNGNQVARLHEGVTGIDTATTYSFDALGRLEAVSEGGRLLLAALYDGDNNRIFTASRNPDPTYIDTTDRIWQLAQGVAASTDTTRTANLEADSVDTYTPQVAPPTLDLFWYGVAQGISNLSHISPYLTSWLNSVWTLEAESIRVETSLANNRADNAELLSDFVHVPDSPYSDVNFTDLINSEDYTITRFVLDTNVEHARVLATYNEQGDWTATYTFGNGVLGMNTEVGAETFFTDGRGSVSEAINRDSRAITTYRYDAFGNVEVQGSSTNPFTYNQEWFDFSTGLQFLRARYVDLELSRFVSRDSVLGTLHDPRTHNLYLYVQNDPLNNIDPSGHVMQMGTGTNQPATWWNRCNLCHNDGRNVPRNRTHCARCTRARIDACRECGRVGCRGQCMTPARRLPLPPPSGGNQGQRTNDANNQSNKKNSNAVPPNQTSSQVDWRRLEGYLGDITAFVISVWGLYAGAVGFAAGMKALVVPAVGVGIIIISVIGFLASTVGIIRGAEAFGRALQGLLRGDWINQVPPPQEGSVISHIGSGRVTRGTLQPMVNRASSATGNFSTFTRSSTGRTVSSAIESAGRAGQWNGVTSSISNADSVARRW